MSEYFHSAVKTAFSFLDEAGFGVALAASNEVTYEKKNVFVKLSWDPRSGELNMFLGLKGKLQTAYSFTDILKFAEIDLPEANQPFQVSDENQLLTFLEKLAYDLQSYASLALTGDLMYFRRLEVFRHSQSMKLVQGFQLRSARIQAAEAWRSHNYKKVVSLYTQIENHLTESEKSKFAYAKQNE